MLTKTDLKAIQNLMQQEVRGEVTPLREEIAGVRDQITGIGARLM